jgi:hypothetical protein
MSIFSATSGLSRGGGFRIGGDGKKFSVCLIVKDDFVCLSDIGDGAKFCLRVGCTVVSHKEAKKFDPSNEGSVVIAKGRVAKGRDADSSRIASFIALRSVYPVDNKVQEKLGRSLLGTKETLVCICFDLFCAGPCESMTLRRVDQWRTMLSPHVMTRAKQPTKARVMRL